MVYNNMTDSEIKSYFQDNIIEDEKEARAILETVKDQKLLTQIVMRWSGFRKNNLIIIDYIDDEECLANIYMLIVLIQNVVKKLIRNGNNI